MKKIKFILPVLAFLFAVVAAFATSLTAVNISARPVVATSQGLPSECGDVGSFDCNTTDTNICTISTVQYANTTCTAFLRKD